MGLLDSAPEVTVSERYGTNNITVTIEWTQIRNDVQYNVSTEPPVDVNFIGNVSIQMTVFYNTFYSVSITANGLCNSTAAVGLNYSELIRSL